MKILRRADRIRRGDCIVLETVFSDFAYRIVERTYRIENGNRLGVEFQTPGTPDLTLYTDDLVEIKV